MGVHLFRQMISGSAKPVAVVRFLVVGLVTKVTVSVVLGYVDYLPPDFTSEFLLGRGSYFFGAYSVAFYVHIVTGPITLLTGIVLMSTGLLKRFPHWHRRLGKLQVVCVLATAVSGLWMARYAGTGIVAGAGFATLAIATATTVICGFQTAIQRRFAEHRIWMTRCFLLLCSAVVLRLTAGLAIVTRFDADWVYPMSAWTSWLVPLGIYEFIRRGKEGGRRKRPGFHRDKSIEFMHPEVAATSIQTGGDRQ